MELDLTAVDYVQVAVTDKKCMKILPNNDKRRVTQKVVVGDKSGVLQCFGMKKRELNSIFKLLPGPPVSKLELGGALGTPQDKIFASCGSEVRGYSRKGKKFLDFNSNLTEPISNLCISGSDLVVAGLYICNYFCDCVDQGYYLSNDRINDIICLPVNRRDEDRLVSVLACNDRILRILEATALKYELEVPGPPQCVVPFKDTGGEEGMELVYGTTDGKVGHVMLNNEQPEYKWEIVNEKNLGGISCLTHHDITGDGVPDLLVGRDDGTVEIFSYDIAEEPVLRFAHNFKESITAIQGGVVGSLGFDEVVVSTYAGWVSGLTTEHMQKKVTSSSIPGNTNSANTQPADMDEDTQKKITNLRSEVEALQISVESERGRHMEQTSKAIANNSSTLTRPAAFHINDKFVLSPVDASYHLSIEVQTAIDHVVLQSDVPVDLLDKEETSAVVAYTSIPPPTPDSSGDDNFLLATYRCQSNTTRLEMKVRSIEGQFGHLQAYVIPLLKPKSCVVRRYPIKPLSLHQRTHDFDEQRPMNVLHLSGPFSVAEIHSWVAFCLPDVPERPPAGDTVNLYFANTFLDTQLACIYSKGEGIFRSDNISTISILKDMLTKEATAKKINLNIQYEVSDDSIAYTLQLLHPKLDKQLMLAKKVQLLDALQELQVHEGSMDFLAPEYREILAEADKIKAEFKKQPARLERLYGMITDLFIDKHKFKGVNVKQKVPQLLETLDNYELPALIDFFHQSVY
uniref:Bardet-Biedl syndrome 7 protein homolog n=1 Tax=Phallusia mammillata TaxID=59560 RepID=A0A6F9D881_9ASCI|nr:Bardet-Biedl syndrome 7 protein homolog [Phallusia mammillata]